VLYALPFSSDCPKDRFRDGTNANPKDMPNIAMVTSNSHSGLQYYKICDDYGGEGVSGEEV